MVIIVTTALIGTALLALSFRKQRAALCEPKCPKCRYNMTQLDRLECPECGFRVENVQTWAIRPLRWRRAVLRIIAMPLLIYVVTMGWFAVGFAVDRYRITSLSRKADIDGGSLHSRVTLNRRTLDVGCDPIPWFLTPLPWARRVNAVEWRAPSNDQDFSILCSFPELTKLQVYNCKKLTEAGLVKIKNASKLRECSLADFSCDSVMNLVSDLPEIETLTIHGRANGVARGLGSKLEPLKKMRSLKALTLIDVEVGDEGVNQLAGIPNLESLCLDNANIKGPGLADLKSLPSLRFLSLAGPTITDESLAALENVTQIEGVVLEKTGVHGKGLKHLTKANLTTLLLSESPIGDECVEVIAKIPSLHSVMLSNIQITEVGLEKLAAITTLQRIRFSGTLSKSARERIERAYPGKLEN